MISKSQRQKRGEGEDMGGTQLRSRMEKFVSQAGMHDRQFRDRPEIARMRARAASFRENAGGKNETLEEAARRISRRARG